MADFDCKISFPDGVCTRACLDFLRFVRSLGQKFEGTDTYRLRNICLQMNKAASDIPVLHKDTAITIAQRRESESQGTQLNRIRILRKLAEYMISAGYDAYILPKHFTQKYKYDFKPYVFSHEQIADILRVADQLTYHPRSPHAHLVIPTILRVFFGCGLRSSEARLLKTNHVDLNDGILFIEKSKQNISRYVPVSESLIMCLRKYSIEMGFNMVSSTYFFPSPSGGPYHDTTLRGRFRAIMSAAQIKYFDNGQLPRIHDTRHSFVVHSYATLIPACKL